MASLLIKLSLTLCVVFQPVFSDSSQCVSIKGGPFEACSASGYNNTFPIPRKLSARSVRDLKRGVAYITSLSKNCSVANVAETMFCSYIAPYCKGGSAFLPCRRVCSEFLKRCESIFPFVFVDLVVAMCTLLPNSTYSQGKCYEPPQFLKYHNASSEGPLERKCEKIIIPLCKDAGYPYTIVPLERQKSLYRFYYGKNYTETDSHVAKAEPASDSLLQKLLYAMGNHSTCAKSMKKLYCAEAIQPCFKDEGLAFYTVCKDVCLSIGSQCPKFLESDIGRFLYCERMAAGNTTTRNGFCRHTSWPPPMKWLDTFQERQPNSKKEKGGIGGAVIAIVVLVPIIVVGIVIGFVFYYKRRKLTSQGYSKQEDDKVDLVT